MRPVAPLTAARLADRELGLADRIASSLELKDKGHAGPLAQTQIADTLDRVATVHAREKVASQLDFFTPATNVGRLHLLHCTGRVPADCDRKPHRSF